MLRATSGTVSGGQISHVRPVTRGRSTPTTGHFVERHGLIVIIAIGESLVAIGIGARVTALSAAVIVAAVLGLGVAAAFWLGYFDYFPRAAQRVLAERSGTQRNALARDLYTYLHLPIVAGIVLFAFAMKKTLAHVGDELDTVPAVAPCVGPALMLLAFWAMRARIGRTLRWRGGRLVAGMACLLLIPVATAVPALAALALVAAVWVGLHAYELIWWRETRGEIRSGGLLRLHEPNPRPNFELFVRV